MIREDGYLRHSIWDHSATVRNLYAARACGEAEEMTCAAQAAELLAPLVRRGDTLLDAGCGSGYFLRSLRARGIAVEYYGIDASPSLIALGRAALDLPPERLRNLRIEDLDGTADHVLCMNVLSNIDNYHRPLDRLLAVAQRSLILRESLKAGAEYRYVRDDFLDPEIDLRVHVNAYDIDEVEAFIAERGFRSRRVLDRRSGGAPELVIGYPHWWNFLVAERIA